ncbi:MAG TPA: hypothetical protein VMS17_27670 [Gemmataceae bacterium]|nr:hypothetical protein [Gemmataceae bacterium]
MGTAMLWGAFGVTLFGVLLTPVFFYVVRGLVGRRTPTRESAAVASNGRSRGRGATTPVPSASIDGAHRA